MCKRIGKSIMILFVGTLVGTVLLWLSYLMPVSEDNVHVAESIDILEQEGWYPVVPFMHSFTGEPMERDNGGILDNFTDSIMITTAGRKPVEGALYQAMNMASEVFENGYSYYWHGYVVILRPLLWFLDYADIRVLNQLLQMMIIIIMTCMVYRKKGIAYAAIPFTIYGLLMPMAVSQSLQFSWVFYISIIGAMIVVKFRDQLSKAGRISLFFLVLGMFTSYFDLLTYPLFTWGIPMIWWIVMEEHREGIKEQLQQVLFCGISWIFGYGGLWAGKWFIGGVIIHKPIAAQAWNEVLYRSGRSQNSAEYLPSYGKTILSNLEVCMNVQIVFLLGLWIVWWCYRIIKNSYRVKGEKTLPLLLIALSPICWFIMLHNHTYVHTFFTYRICVIGIIALLASMINSLDSGEKMRHCSKKKWLAPALIVLLAISVALNLKDEVYVHNGNYEVTDLELEDGIQCVQEFRPTYKRVASVNINLKAEGEGPGEIDVRILDEDRGVLWEHSVLISEVVGGRFYELPLELRLDNKKTYQISIAGINIERNHAWVGVVDGQRPLTELQTLKMGSQEYDAQLTFGVRYGYRAGLLKILFAIQLQLLIYWNLYLIIRIVHSWCLKHFIDSQKATD